MGQPDRKASVSKADRLPLSEIRYRQKMRIREVMVFSSPVYGKIGYYVCPRCSTTLEREFMPFCDRCGQRLDWRGYRKAKKICPGSHHHQ